jgi:hypothetical protein
MVSTNHSLRRRRHRAPLAFFFAGFEAPTILRKTHRQVVQACKGLPPIVIGGLFELVRQSRANRY